MLESQTGLGWKGPWRSPGPWLGRLALLQVLQALVEEHGQARNGARGAHWSVLVKTRSDQVNNDGFEALHERFGSFFVSN